MMKEVLKTIAAWALFLFFVWAIVHTIRHPEDMTGCPPDNYSYRCGGG